MSAQVRGPTLPVELDDVQGLLNFGYKHHVEACFLLLRVRDRDAARTWLGSVRVSSAVVVDPVPSTVLQIALSGEGLRALGVAPDIISGFSPEFVAGMSSGDSRARRLGDVGANDPTGWKWGTGNSAPHVLLLLYAKEGQLAAWQQMVEGQLSAGFECIGRLPASPTQGIEPFGFLDGISQPEPDWHRQRPMRDECQLAYTNLSCLGEFLLGYPNEYGAYTERPLLDRARDPGAMLPGAEDAPGKADLGRNGSYLVMRQLRQDVSGFWKFVDGCAGGDPVLRKRLAEAMVGRTQEGESLVGRTGEVIRGGARGAPESDPNAFTYRSDPRGERCPLAAHVRRANPRNADLPPGAPGIVSRLTRLLGFDEQARAQDLVASTRFHRLLRRGRKYDVGDSGPQAPAGAPADEVGLHFICLVANISRQFEFVQSAWVMGTKFDGLPGESDPLLGNRQPRPDGTRTDGFSMPQSLGPDQRLTGLPQFVTVLGGAYFFLPGIRALRYLATTR